MSDETNTYGDDIHLTTTDATTIYNTLIAALEKGAGEPLYPGDERRIFGEGLVAVFVALYNSLDDTGRQTLLRYARGEVLDAIGERLDVHRLEGSPAKTTMRFSVSTPQPNNIIIPKWTKVTPDSDHYFATDEIAVLQAGAYSVEIPTSAVSNGTEYNGYAPGTITTLVDLIPYIESVTNITATAGGDDGEPYTEEGDNRLRERIRLAPASRSTAGPEQAYIYWAMTADSSIIDARAVSETETISRTLTVYDGHAFIGGGRLLPDTLIVKEHGESTAGVEDTDYTVDYTDDLLTIELKGALTDATSLDITITRTLEGCVKIVPLLEGGAVPDESILEKVLEACNASDIRPLTDVVTAVAPEVITYDIEIVYYTTPETEAEVVANVEGTGGAIDRYNEWQVGALGRDINPDQLRKRILCKIANELRKYRDLTGCINRVSLSDDPKNYAEYVVTGELSYLDMVTANAVYSLWRSGEGKNGFGAETIGKVMAGDMARRLRKEKREEMENRLRRLAGTEIYILADHDQQAMQAVYEGPILPLDWEEAGSGLRFCFRPDGQMVLYQYAEERNQLIRVPIDLLRDDRTLGQTKLNNSDQTLLLRHCLLQELEIVLYPGNQVEQRELRLLKRDESGDEYGLLWTLGLLEEGQSPAAEAKRAQQTIVQLMENWRKSGYVTEKQYQLLPAEKGYGILLLSGNKTETKRNKKVKK